jgi:hypothetical protein
VWIFHRDSKIAICIMAFHGEDAEVFRGCIDGTFFNPEWPMCFDDENGAVALCPTSDINDESSGVSSNMGTSAAAVPSGTGISLEQGLMWRQARGSENEEYWSAMIGPDEPMSWQHVAELSCGKNPDQTQIDQEDLLDERIIFIRQISPFVTESKRQSEATAGSLPSDYSPRDKKDSASGLSPGNSQLNLSIRDRSLPCSPRSSNDSARGCCEFIPGDPSSFLEIRSNPKYLRTVQQIYLSRLPYAEEKRIKKQNAMMEVLEAKKLFNRRRREEKVLTGCGRVQSFLKSIESGDNSLVKAYEKLKGEIERRREDEAARKEEMTTSLRGRHAAFSEAHRYLMSNQSAMGRKVGFDEASREIPKALRDIETSSKELIHLTLDSLQKVEEGLAATVKADEEYRQRAIYANEYKACTMPAVTVASTYMNVKWA